MRRSPDGSIETAFALVTGAGEVGRVMSGEGSSYGRHSSPQLRTGRVLAGEMPHDASGTGLADLERLMVGLA